MEKKGESRGKTNSENQMEKGLTHLIDLFILHPGNREN
jgi:hypothetical protein